MPPSGWVALAQDDLGLRDALHLHRRHAIEHAQLRAAV
jgi:hypothetical protein